MISSAFIDALMTTAQEQIAAINAALLFLAANPHKSYQLDTGQSSQRVTRDDIGDLNAQIDVLLNRLTTLDAMRNGATIQIRPGF